MLLRLCGIVMYYNYLCILYERYAGHDDKVLRSVALLPWSHNLLFIS